MLRRLRFNITTPVNKVICTTAFAAIAPSSALRFASTKPDLSGNTTKPSTTSATSEIGWGDYISSSVGDAWNRVSSGFEGVKVETPEQIKENAPSWIHPIKRMQYRNYVLEQTKQQEQSYFSSMTSSSEQQQPPSSATIADQIKKLGLDPQSTFSVLLVYVGFWLAFTYYCLTVIYFSIYFHYFSGCHPVDPRSKSIRKDSEYDDEFIGTTTSSSGFSSLTSSTPSLLSNAKFIKSVHDDMLNSNKLVIVHSIPGAGKSTFIRRLANEVSSSENNSISDVIYIRVNTNSIATSDPIDMIAQYYGISSHQNTKYVLSIMKMFNKISSVFTGKKNAKPLLVFDIGLLPTSSSSLLLKTGGSHNHFNQTNKNGSHHSNSSSSNGDSSSSSASSSNNLFDLPLFSSGNGLRLNGFDLSTFMDRAHALACDDEHNEFSVMVALDTTLLNTEAPSFFHNDSVTTIEISELDERKAVNFISKLTDQYMQSMIGYSKKTPRFLKERLASTMNNNSSNGDGDGNPMKNARKLLSEEYKLMESATASVFANCREEKKLKECVKSEGQLVWSDVEKYCGNKYGSNEHFRQIAELREGLFTSTGPSTYKPRFDVVRDKILNGKKFMEK